MLVFLPARDASPCCLPLQWEDDIWQEATEGVPLYYNVHRWYEYGTGRYTRLDPIGLSEERTSYYEYAELNPLLNSDPEGLLVVSPDAKCNKRKLRRALSTLSTGIPNDCLCRRFFSEALGGDLTNLLAGPLPIVKTFGNPTVTAGVGGITPCKGSDEIKIARFRCSRGTTREIAQAILHELAHFADCERQRFPRGGPIEEGGLAELHCFGTITDIKPVVQVPFVRLR